MAAFYYVQVATKDMVAEAEVSSVSTGTGASETGSMLLSAAVTHNSASIWKRPAGYLGTLVACLYLPQDTGLPGYV
jgi:hypothetical protein